jgi:short-subunit dehydrogenase
MRTRNILLASATGAGIAGTALGIGAIMTASALWKRARAREDFRGQVVVITGGSRGLGFAIAREFASQGARLVICARDEGPLHEAEHKLIGCGAEVLVVRCDLSVRQEAESLIRRATDRFGQVDVLVNNAGTIEVGPLETQTIEDFEEAMRTMFWGALYTSLAVLPQMRDRRRGRIANITSIGGKVAIPHLLPYCSAKFAAVGFSEGLRSELAKDNVKVTTIVPGLMRTGSHMNAIFKGDHRKEYAWFSLGATLPVTAISASTAATKIVNAIARGSAEVILSPQAKALALAHGVAPGLVADALGMVNRILPGTGSRDAERFTGKESETLVSRSFLTKLGRSAGRELNQHPERGPVGGERARPARSSAVQGNPGAVLAD